MHANPAQGAAGRSGQGSSPSWPARSLPGNSCFTCASSSICVHGSMERSCTFKLRANMVCQVKSWCDMQSSSKHISFVCLMVNFSCECHVQLLTANGVVCYANVMQWDSRLSCYCSSHAGTHAAGHSSPRGSGPVWACSRLRLPPSGLPSAPKHGGQSSGGLPRPGKHMLTICLLTSCCA